MLIWNVDAVVAEENQMAEKMTVRYVGANIQKNPFIMKGNSPKSLKMSARGTQ